MAFICTLHRAFPIPPDNTKDETEQLWDLYYKTTFNPARVNLKLMRSHIPIRHWQQMPELDTLAPAIAEANPRVEQMVTVQSDFPGAQA